MSEVENFLWVTRYKPKTVDECILPTSVKTKLQSFVETGQIPNVILTGNAGAGKTSSAEAMISQLGSEFYKINSSLYGNIDTLRNEILQFASSVSMNGNRKYVILDEADKTTSAFQGGLRAFIDEFASNTGFILTCNYKSKLIEPLHSRCPIIEFNFNVGASEKKELLTQLLRRMVFILNDNGIKFEKESLIGAVKRWFPDMRRLIGELQSYATAAGTIDAGILANFTESRLESLLDAMKDRDFTSVRKWVTENGDIDAPDLYAKLYERLVNTVTPSSIPIAVIILAKYQYQSAFARDNDINTAACMAELMVEMTWLE